ncbi:MAG: LysR substrate-binding domain-containing protein [Dysgonamonadaceae bacterium]|nr:LysR substrate-binding domain-containing protein [Dysgonamonadaceae bacterium]MDD4727214.1 LysR substrate-binding domain-containing protein [Dysgonamonadaceae bacterium]
MNIQQLEYIVAVDNNRHFSKAAEASFVTQPTLSMMIQKLEDELGVKIFDRTKSPIEPTEVGRKIIDQARVSIAQIHHIKEIVEEEKGETKGVFHLAIIPTVSPYLLPKLMQTHREQNTDIRLVINEMTTNQILSGLANGTVDGGILATPLHDDRMKERPVYYEKFFGYISPNERFLHAKQYLEESDLSGAKLWLLDEVHCFRTQILNLCNLKKRNVVSSAFTYEAGSIETLINIVDNNNGITVIPEMALDHLTEKQRMNVRFFKNDKHVREISLITRKDFVRERFIDIIEEEIKMSVPAALQDKALQKNLVAI